MTLAAVERVLAADACTASLALAMLRTVRDPWRPEAEEEIDAAALAARAGVKPDPSLVVQLVEGGIVRLLPDGKLRLLHDVTSLMYDSHGGRQAVRLARAARRSFAALVRQSELRSAR